jgi:hypothetical protein
MQPVIIENYTNLGVDAGRIVRRILAHLPPDILEGLREIRLLDRSDTGFACYRENERIIEIYMATLLGDFPPILLKLLYPFTYMFIGMALGHELDHHVSRNNREIDREASAEANIMRYVYPSLGVFKPAVRIISFGARKLDSLQKKRIKEI